jgi:hypothetical protein
MKKLNKKRNKIYPFNDNKLFGMFGGGWPIRAIWLCTKCGKKVMSFHGDCLTGYSDWDRQVLNYGPPKGFCFTKNYKRRNIKVGHNWVKINIKDGEVQIDDSFNRSSGTMDNFDHEEAYNTYMKKWIAESIKRDNAKKAQYRLLNQQNLPLKNINEFSKNLTYDIGLNFGYENVRHNSKQTKDGLHLGLDLFVKPNHYGFNLYSSYHYSCDEEEEFSFSKSIYKITIANTKVSYNLQADCVANQYWQKYFNNKEVHKVDKHGTITYKEDGKIIYGIETNKDNKLEAVYVGGKQFDKKSHKFLNNELYLGYNNPVVMQEILALFAMEEEVTVTISYDEQTKLNASFNPSGFATLYDKFSHLLPVKIANINNNNYESKLVAITTNDYDDWQVGNVSLEYSYEYNIDNLPFSIEHSGIIFKANFSKVNSFRGPMQKIAFNNYIINEIESSSNILGKKSKYYTFNDDEILAILRQGGEVTIVATDAKGLAFTYNFNATEFAEIYKAFGVGFDDYINKHLQDEIDNYGE